VNFNPKVLWELSMVFILQNKFLYNNSYLARAIEHKFINHEHTTSIKEIAVIPGLEHLIFTASQ